MRLLIRSDHALRARSLALSVGRSKFKAFVKRRLRTRPRRWAHFEDSPATQCPRCDKGQHRSCIRLKYCKAKDRSPPGTGNKREKGARNARPYGCAPRSQCATIHVCVSRVSHCRMPAVARAMSERLLLNRRSFILLHQLLTRSLRAQSARRSARRRR